MWFGPSAIARAHKSQRLTVVNGLLKRTTQHRSTEVDGGYDLKYSGAPGGGGARGGKKEWGERRSRGRSS